MATIASIFGKYAESANLQYLVDKSLEKFAPTWFDNYFDWAPQQMNLTFTTVVGRSRVEAAASVVDRGSKAPLRSRAGLEQLSGKVPAIMEKFALDEVTVREHEMLRSMPGGGDAFRSQIIDLITDDVVKAGDSTMKRVDIMALEAVSTGKISLTTTNNPDGVVLEPLDLLMPSTSRVNALASWTGSPLTAAPITKDIQGIMNLARPRGIRLAKILMTWDSWFAFIATKEVQDLYGSFIGKTANKLLPTLDNMNELLRGQALPTIEMVDVSIGIEKNGIISTIQPFENTNIAFIPEGKLGRIHNAFAIEETRRINQVSYAKYNRTLISKWGDNDPYQEFTKAELNAMPALEAIDSMYLLSRTASFV